MKLSHAIGYCSLMLALSTACHRKIAPQEPHTSSAVETGDKAPGGLEADNHGAGSSAADRNATGAVTGAQGPGVSGPVTIVPDGDASEWSLPLHYANSQYTLSYSISNDSRNIYVCIMTTNPEMRHRIMKAGMTLYFDPKGKQKKKMALVYPERNMDGIKVPTVYNSDGFLNMDNGQHNLTDKMAGIKIGLNPMADNGALVYEVAVPLSRVLANGLTEKALRKNFSVGIVVNQLPGKRGGPGDGQGQRGGGGMQPRVSFGGGVGMGGMSSGMGMGMGIGLGGGRGGRGGIPDPEDATWASFRFAAPEKK
ncbi:hypothetical protein [Chitinophaga sancti]|uniref:Uncharacterized protein n=1 Tax=Chitinophaga sancti TaxID=1004 RepID=A0A1K1LNY8_9BACT|nr:hypothetical protein [Chitinophaga sancti]WQD64971.1 hypothetical protein U0033_11250 [Chitinophaga sancti]WQG89405.1 hypothetical protein SR876_31220 [Chitinophaga sancti]SFW12588.1 hypothetical protein SAMN05661012_00090 [Chitinophaga sancti]